eukprot:1138012-Pelagomonas_calceolata.AAC.4
MVLLSFRRLSQHSECWTTPFLKVNAGFNAGAESIVSRVAFPKKQVRMEEVIAAEIHLWLRSRCV